MAEATPPSPRRKERFDKSEHPVTFLPIGNPAASWGYVLVLIGLVPILGLVTGPLAVIFGYFGRRKARKDPNQKGIGHSVVCFILGSTEFFCNALGIFFLGMGLDWWNI